MDETRDLAAFDHGQMIGTRRMGHSISKIVREQGFSSSTVSRQEYYENIWMVKK